MDPDYQKLCESWLPQVIYDIDQLEAATRARRQLITIPRDMRTRGQVLYLDVLMALINDYLHKQMEPKKGLAAALAGGVHDVIRPDDRWVLRLLLCYSIRLDDDLDEMAELMGIPPVNLRDVHQGTRTFTRDEIARACNFFHAEPRLFDMGPFRGRRRGRFVVHEFSSHFEVQDTVSRRWASMGDGVDQLSLVDAHDNDYTQRSGVFGFAADWEVLLNIDEEETLRAYFPDVYEKESKDDAKEK